MRSADGAIALVFLLVNYSDLKGLGLSAIASLEAVSADLMRQTLGEAEGELDGIHLKSQRKFYETILERSPKYNTKNLFPRRDNG